MYNEGISVAGDILDVGVTEKVIHKSGNTYSFGEEKLGIGREKVKTYLNENPKTLDAIKGKIWETIERGAAPPEEEGAKGEETDVEEDMPEA